MKEVNPFENKKVANIWINSVENEKGMVRDKEVYPLIQKWADKLNPETILEIGSGQGIISKKVKFKGNYIGIEPSKYLVQRAKKLYQNKNIKFTVSNAYSLPFKRNSIDAAFSVNVLFHLANLKKASSELSRVLRPGSNFLIITANPGEYKTWESFYFDSKKIGKKIIGKIWVLPNNIIPNSIFYEHSLREINSSFELSGLKILKTKAFGVVNKKKIFFAIFGKKL